jgi:hypothetical protein
MSRDWSSSFLEIGALSPHWPRFHHVTRSKKWHSLVGWRGFRYRMVVIELRGKKPLVSSALNFARRKGRTSGHDHRTFAPESWIFRQGYHSDNIRFDATIIQQMVSFAPFTSCSIPFRVLAPLSLHPTSCPCACTHIYISAIRSYF